MATVRFTLPEGETTFRRTVHGGMEDDRGALVHVRRFANAVLRRRQRPHLRERLAGRVLQLPGSWRFRGVIGHASPHPVAITLSDVRANSSVSGFG